MQYYVDNSNNTFFTHEGHTTILTATSGVQPCQTYHLKMVIMDVGNNLFDSGVFLEAGSLRSDPLQIDNHIQLNEFNKPYLAEGCSSGSIHVTRNRKKSYSQTFNLQFSGTAINGVDVMAIPSSVTIPANDSVVAIPITAIADFVPENNEKLKIYILNSCSSFFSDSIEIELRDIDMLAVAPDDSIHICRNGLIQLQAQNGYADYSWTNSFTLSDAGIANPVAVPISSNTNYVCTATSGNCTARDSVLVKWKTIELLNKTDVQCHNGASGSINVAGKGWKGVTGFALNNGTYQSSGTFPGLPAGNYYVKVKDASGCVDSIQVELLQLFPDLTIATSITAATCSLAPDGKI